MCSDGKLRGALGGFVVVVRCGYTRGGGGVLVLVREMPLPYFQYFSIGIWPSPHATNTRAAGVQ